MSYSRLRVHHLNCACIQRLSIDGKKLGCHVLLVETPASGKGARFVIELPHGGPDA